MSTWKRAVKTERHSTVIG